jgi:hypothetical protein
MGRKRIDLGNDADARIVASMVRGESAAVVARTLGCSLATAKRRMAELRKGVPAARAEKRGASPKLPATTPRAKLPDPDGVIPEETTLEQIGEWLKLAKEEIAAASLTPGSEPETIAKMVRLAATLLALQVKATPPPKPDPNDNPDFVAAAERVRKRWHDLLEKVKAA